MAGFYSERMGKSQRRNHCETGSQQKKPRWPKRFKKILMP